MKDGRYPYTHAADFIRMIPEKIGDDIPEKIGDDIPGIGKVEVKLSRADASQIINEIAKSINMPKEELAMHLAETFLETND